MSKEISLKSDVLGLYRYRLKKVRDNSAGPSPDGIWKWRCPETNFLVTHSNYRGLELAVKSYLKSNSFPIGSDFERQFEENICRTMPHVCIEWESPSSLERLGSVARAIYQTAKQWREPVVTAEEFQDRKDWCAGNNDRPRCNFFGGSTSLLKIACQKCGCSGLKLALKSSRCPVNKWTL